jgi:hypothetical protein
MTTAAKKTKVRIGESILTRDLVWCCECGRGLSLSGKWLYCPNCGTPIDQESYFVAVEQAKVNGASHFYRDPESHEHLDRIRAAMVGVFGGMGKGSAIWGQGQWDKGWTAGIQAAILAFDTEREK